MALPAMRVLWLGAYKLSSLMYITALYPANCCTAGDDPVYIVTMLRLKDQHVTASLLGIDDMQYLRQYMDRDAR